MSRLMKKGIGPIIDNRAIGEIDPENPYIYARAFSTDGFIRHSQHLNSFIEEKSVENMSTRKMHAYLVTKFQVVD